MDKITETKEKILKALENNSFNNLTDKEKEKVKELYYIMMTDEGFECHKLHKNIEEFWESHKEMDFSEMLV